MSIPSMPELHGAVVHFPIALLVTGLVFEMASILRPNRDWRVAGFWMLAAGVVMAIPAAITGLLTGNFLFRTSRPPDIFITHRAAAIVSIVLAVTVFAWRARSRDGLDGNLRLYAAAILLVATLTVGFTGYLGGRMVFAGRSAAATVVDAPSQDTPPIPLDPEKVSSGARLVQSEDYGCLNCHNLNGKGGTNAPNLTRVGSRRPDSEWHVRHLENPAAVVPGSMMPSFSGHPPQEIEAIAEYLTSLR